LIPSREPGSFRSIALILQRKSARGRRPHWRRPGLRRERNFSFDIGALTAISDGGLGMLPIHTQWFTIPRLSPAFTAGHKGWSRSNSSVGGSSGGAKLPRSRGRCAIGANRPAQCHELRVWRLESFRARQRTAGFRRRPHHRFSPSHDIPTDSPQRTPAGVFWVARATSRSSAPMLAEAAHTHPITSFQRRSCAVRIRSVPRTAG